MLMISFSICLHFSCTPLQTPPKLSNHYSNKKKVHTEYARIPAWFIQKPEIPGVNLSFAYSSRYLEKEIELQQLLISAAKNIQIANETQIIVLQTGSLQADTFTGGTQIIECDVSLDMNSISNNYTIIEQYPIGNGILAIAAETSQLSKGHPLKINTLLKKVNILSPPKWAIKPPTRKGFIYGVGLAPSYSSPEKAWGVAEQNARADIVLQVIVKIRNKSKSFESTDFGYHEENIKAWSNFKLKNVSIIKHGYCKPDRTYYALARMKEIDAELIKLD